MGVVEIQGQGEARMRRSERQGKCGRADEHWKQGRLMQLRKLLLWAESDLPRCNGSRKFAEVFALRNVRSHSGSIGGSTVFD